MIELKNVEVFRPSFTLGPVSKCFNLGKIYMLMGENGAGKTTLLDVISTLIIPDKGSVDIDGKISYAPQGSDDAFFLPTVLEEFSYTLGKIGKDEVRRKAQALLSLVGLPEEYLYSSPFSLSGGEKRLISIALAIASDPDFLLLDESVSGLDYKGYMALRRLIAGFKERGKGVLFITHDLDMLDLADETVVMREGKIAFSGCASDAMAKGYVEKSFAYEYSVKHFSTPILSLKEIAARSRHE